MMRPEHPVSAAGHVVVLADLARRADRPARRSAFLLAAPLIIFLTVTFFVPIAWVLATALDNSEPRQVLPETFKALSA
jgi:putative spermidine/putrescine transport system permease protein